MSREVVTLPTVQVKDEVEIAENGSLNALADWLGALENVFHAPFEDGTPQFDCTLPVVVVVTGPV